MSFFFFFFFGGGGAWAGGGGGGLIPWLLDDGCWGWLSVAYQRGFWNPRQHPALVLRLTLRSHAVSTKQDAIQRWSRASCPRMSVDILGTNCDQCRSMVQCCLTSTETVRLIRTESQDGHLDFHTAPELWCHPGSFCFTSTETRWLIRDGTGTGGGGGGGGRGRKSEGSTEKDRRDRGPPPEQWKCYGGVPLLLPSDLCAAQLLFQLLCLGRVTKTMSVHCCWRTTRSERSLTFAAQLHLPTHDLFWANLKVQLHLPPLRSLDLLISPGTLKMSCSV